jgi:hypothetical protein
MTTFQLHQLIIAVTITFMGNAASAADSSALPDAPSVIVDKGIAPSQQESMSLAARRYYAFWNTGDASFAKAALDSNFIDRTLPPAAHKELKVPYLRPAIFELPYPISLLRSMKCSLSVTAWWAVCISPGTSPGTSTAYRVREKVDFIATDIYRIADGRIAENWHLEDNLTLLQQLGIVGH